MQKKTNVKKQEGQKVIMQKQHESIKARKALLDSKTNRVEDESSQIIIGF
jgi:hypothetical protein